MVKKKFMTAAGKPSNILHIEECDIIQLILSKVFYLVFCSCMNYHLTEKYKNEEHVAT